MTIQGIISKRGHERNPSYDIIYEWEDELSRQLNLPIIKEPKWFRHKILYKTRFIQDLFVRKQYPTFYFEINATTRFTNPRNSKRFIPYIVDFYIDKQHLSTFVRNFRNCQVVYVSSLEAYTFLKENKCPLNIKHAPITLPDCFKSDEEIPPPRKSFDLVLFGRQNPVLISYLERYQKKHPELKYVYRIWKGKQYLYYTSDGELLGDINTREQYIQLMESARVSFYSVPGIDNDERQTNGFHQITPRLLELIACECHVIARWKDNPDTDYFDIKDMTLPAQSYEEFEHSLQYALTHQINKKKYSDYLGRHLTSASLTKHLL